MLLLERMSTIFSDFPVSDQWMIKAIGASMACFTIGLPILKNFILKVGICLEHHSNGTNDEWDDSRWQ
jgi:hypothetical protein